jgi:hypothetical protein
VLASVFGALGVMLSGSAVIGPSVVGFSILVALLARLAQSHDHHKAWQAAQARRAEPVPERVSERASERVSEWVSEPVSEPVPEPVREPVREPVSEPVSDPVPTP